eukprot:gene6626-4775_t
MRRTTASTVPAFEEWLGDIEESESVEELQLWCREMNEKCPAFSLCLQVVDLIVRWNENSGLDVSVVRQVFELVLGTCGMDIVCASDLWRRYLDFELTEHEEFLESSEASDPEALRKSKERFIKVVERQLSLPLVGNEETLQRLEGILEEYCSESDVSLIKPDQLQRKFRTAVSAREERLTYEIYLHGDAYKASDDGSKLLSWQTYIDFEVQAKEFSRAQRLFERAMLEAACAARSDMWLRYAVFALCRLKAFGLASSVLTRASQLHATSLWIRRLQLVALEGAKVAEPFVQRAQGVLSESLQWGFASSLDYLQLFLAHANHLRRWAAAHADEAEVQREVRDALAAAYALFVSYFGQWPDGVAALCRLHSRVILAPLCSANGTGAATEVSAAVAQWDELARQAPRQFWVWREAVATLALTRQPKALARASSIFRRCLNEAQQGQDAFADATASDVALEWLRFEDDFGDLAAQLDALERCRDFVLAVATAQPAAAQSEPPAATETIEVPSNAKNAKKRSRAELASPATVADSDVAPAKKSRAAASQPAEDGGADRSDAQPPSASGDDPAVKHDDQLRRTLFIGRLPVDVDETQLRTFLEADSAVTDSSIVDLRVARERRTGQSKGSALVELVDRAVARAALRHVQQTDFAPGVRLAGSFSKFTLHSAPQNSRPPRPQDAAGTRTDAVAEAAAEAAQPVAIVDVSPPTVADDTAVCQPLEPQRPKPAVTATVTSFRPRGLMKPRLNL